MARHRVFVCYDHYEDANYKRLLQAWNANPDFDFEFDSRGPNVAIKSKEADVVKPTLTRKMKEATHLLVLVGVMSATSEWMAWEIVRATPSGLLNEGTAWATSFERDRIVEALNNAENDY